MKKLWQRFSRERRRRIEAELDQIELELAQEEALRLPAKLFPERPLKASTIVLFCIFGFFVAFAGSVCFKELVVPYFLDNIQRQTSINLIA